MLLLLPALLQSRNVCALVLPPPCCARAARRAAAPRGTTKPGAHQRRRATRSRDVDGLGAAVRALLDVVLDLLSLPEAAEALHLDARLLWGGWVGKGQPREMIANNAGTTQVWMLVSVMCG